MRLRLLFGSDNCRQCLLSARTHEQRRVLKGTQKSEIHWLHGIFHRCGAAFSVFGVYIFFFLIALC